MRKEKVVVKTLLDDGLACGIDQLFTEAKILAKLKHPGVVRLRGYGYTDPANRARPYLVMEHFEGVTLEQYIREQGALSFGEWLVLARQMADALMTAHRQQVLHRDVKPANVLVRSGKEGLSIQIIDFGLALRQETLRDSRAGNTLVGASIAGTLDYAAPEQLGKLPGVKPGPYSDIYGFGRTCCFALFQMTHPGLKQWESVPRPLADLVGRCVGETPKDRPADFAEVLSGLNQVQWDSARRNVIQRVQEAPVVEEVALRPARPARPIRRSQIRDEDEEEEEKWGPRTVVAGLPLWAWGSIGAGFLFVFFGLLIALAIVTRKPSRTLGGPAAVLSSGPAAQGDAVAQALAQLKSPDSNRRGDGARRLKDMLPDERRDQVVQALAPLLDDPNRVNRQTAIEALGVWGNKDAVPLLLKAMRQKETRKVAIVALGRLKDERAIEPIAERLEDLFERREAIQALESIGPAAEPALIVRLHHPERDVRVAACEILRAIGTRKSLPDLEKVVAEKDVFVSPKAKQAIQSITARLPDATPPTKSAEKDTPPPSAPVAPKPSTGGELAAWGTATDPDGDCEFRPDAKTLTVQVPGTLHDLNHDSKLNAPRVLREVEGDFVVTVKVAGDFRPGGTSTNPRGVPYNGAGILLWGDDDHFLRLERGAMLRGGQINTFIAFEDHPKGRRGAAQMDNIRAGDYYLRLERKGNWLSATISADGKSWRRLRAVAGTWPARLKVGLAAINSNSEPFTVRFEEFSFDAKGAGGR